MVAEANANVQIPGTLSRQREVVHAIVLAKEMGFKELYNCLREKNGNGLAWTICLRLKRGLSNPEEPGVYAKDSVYLSGWYNVNKWLEEGNDLRLLYVGEVGLHHPIKDWINQGWVKWKEVPSSWNQSH